MALIAKRIFAKNTSYTLYTMIITKKKLPILFVLTLLINTVSSAQNIWYVTPTGTGNGANNWSNATNDLQQAINSVAEGDQIWVAAGQYKPNRRADDVNTISIDPNDRNNAFVLRKNVKIYGGFSGSETLINERKWRQNETVLSGDVGLQDVESDNTYHIVIAVGDLGDACLDGFVLSEGNGIDIVSPSTIEVFGETIYSDKGANFYCSSSSPLLSNLIFKGGYAAQGAHMYFNNSTAKLLRIHSDGGDDSPYSIEKGGAMYCENNSNLTIANSLFDSCKAAFGGAIFCANTSSISLINVTIAHCNAEAGGGIYCEAGSAINAQNSIIAENIANDGVDIYHESGVVYEYKHCLINDPNASSDDISSGIGLIYSQSPQFRNDYSLEPDSPAMNAGDKTLYNSVAYDDKDLYENERIKGNQIDMGAIEVQCPNPLNNRLYVNTNAPTFGDGSSWQNPLKELAEAIMYAKYCGNGNVKEIWVAQGTYAPGYSINSSSTDNRDKSFVLPENVEIYGGFKGVEDSLHKRNWKANPTILSGDLNGDDDYSYIEMMNEQNIDWIMNREENAYHVVVASSSINNTYMRLDGFIIEGGNGDGIGAIDLNGLLLSKSQGAGIICISNLGNKYYPVFKNLIIRYNYAAAEGGAIYTGDRNFVKPIFNKIEVHNNKAELYGGGIYASSSGSIYANSLIYSNEASIKGGGGACFDGAQDTLVNVTIVNNNSPGGSEIALRASGNARFFNTIIWNTNGIVNVFDINSSYPIYKNSIIKGFTAVNCNGGCLDGTIDDAEIGFVNLYPDFNNNESFDYSLFPESAIRNQGLNGEYDPIRFDSSDLAGNIRITMNTIDLGAYEATCAMATLLAKDTAVCDSFIANLQIDIKVTGAAAYPCEITYTKDGGNTTKALIVNNPFTDAFIKDTLKTSTKYHLISIKDAYGCTTILNDSIEITITVPQPAEIIGDSIACKGKTISLTNATPNGIWKSSNTAIFTIEADGTLTGISLGKANVLYTVTENGCSKTVTSEITVRDVIPPVITIGVKKQNAPSSKE